MKIGKESKAKKEGKKDSGRYRNQVMLLFLFLKLSKLPPPIPPLQCLHPANERRSSKSSLKATQLLTAEQIDKRERKQARWRERGEMERIGGRDWRGQAERQTR